MGEGEREAPGFTESSHQLSSLVDLSHLSGGWEWGARGSGLAFLSDFCRSDWDAGETLFEQQDSLA